MKQNIPIEILTLSHFLEYRLIINEQEVTMPRDCPICAFTYTTHKIQYLLCSGLFATLEKGQQLLWFQRLPYRRLIWEG